VVLATKVTTLPLTEAVTGEDDVELKEFASAVATEFAVLVEFQPAE
jgi:hypothetical protein